MKHTLREDAAIAAMQSLIASSAAAPEDIATDALLYADLLTEELASTHPARQVEESVPLEFEIGEMVYRPRLLRGTVRVHEEEWQNSPAQQARKAMALVTRDEAACIEMCQRLNLCLSL